RTVVPLISVFRPSVGVALGLSSPAGITRLDHSIFPDRRSITPTDEQSSWWCAGSVSLPNPTDSLSPTGCCPAPQKAPGAEPNAGGLTVQASLPLARL